jgi:hypothetical protein
MWESPEGDNTVLELTPEEILRLILACDGAKDVHLPYSEELYASAQLGRKRLLGAILRIEREADRRRKIQREIKEHQK